MLPILGPTTTRDAIGLVGNVFIDPVYQIAHNTEIDNGVVGNSNYSENNYFSYKLMLPTKEVLSERFVKDSKTFEAFLRNKYAFLCSFQDLIMHHYS